ncbi:MAG: hypothetical protein DRN12_03805 [Thermoplasmata archaeon]|nr:MAG: hypothetical protein DRN12_03805 [Thermoplasmata archaeon]
MKCLIVSRLGFKESIYRILRKHGCRKFINYYDRRHAWQDIKDIVAVARQEKCRSIAFICNFSLAMQAMNEGFNKVFVIVPKLHTPAEIVSADIYAIEGAVKVIKELA